MRRIPEPYASVVHRQMSGVPDEQIAEELNLSIDEVERLGREGHRIGIEITSDPEFQAEAAHRYEELRQQSSSSLDRPASARQLLDSSSVLTVERGDESKLGPLAPDAFVWFNDIAAHDFDEIVDEAVVLLRGRLDVRAAHREDRELIIITGSVEIEALQADLQAWWGAKLQQETNA